MNTLKSVFFVTLLFLFNTFPIFAESFSLTHIGALATKGVKYNQWWYEPQRVVLKGTAASESNIALTIDGKTDTIKVNKEGEWSFDLGSLTVADHSVQLSTDTDRYSFTLSIGSAPPTDMSGSKGGLPTAGAIIPFLTLLALSGGLIAYSLSEKRA